MTVPGSPEEEAAVKSMFTKRIFGSFGRRVAFASGSVCLGSELHSRRCFAAGNPLQNYDGLPKFAQIEPRHVEPAITSCLTTVKTEFEAVESSIKKDPSCGYEVIEKLERIQAPLSYSWGVVNHLMGVQNSDELRKAHESVQPSVVRFNQELGQSQALFTCLESIRANKEVWGGLDGAQRRIVDCAIRDMRNSGVGLSPAARPLFNDLQLEVSELSTKFSNNVLDSTKAFKLTLRDTGDVDGLPPSAKALLSKQAVGEGHSDSTPEKGPWVVTLDMPSYLACMQHLKNRDHREALYKAYVARASTGDTDNCEIIRSILRKKRGMAKMLGYKDYAEMSLSSKMAPDTETVLNLLEMLREKSLPTAQAELNNLRHFAKSRGFTGEELALWDVPYWSERLRENAYEFEEEQLRVYFPLESVLSGMFSLAERLFSVRIESADGEEEVWHPDVRFFRIFDKNSENQTPIASFYLDPYSRPAEKRGGAWMDTCVGRSKVLRRIPVAYLTCNGSPPVDGKPSLMTFREVETLFHEFGHGLQHMLTRVEHGDAAGINNIEWDAVELPSQFMENWCYDQQTLYGFAKHYETGAPLPLDLFEKIKAAKNFHAGMAMMRQLYFGMLDLKLHSTYDPAGDLSPFDVQREVAARYSVLPPLPDDRFLCSFGHIFAGGYAAGYYSYKWAEVMSADAFGAFEEAGLDNDAAVRTTGKRFRDTVLSMGGGKPPSEVYKLFRGRDATPDALLRHSGLNDSKP